jgi:outer membrane protein assembly factor BamB
LLALGGASCDSVSSVANPEVPLWVNHPGSAMSLYARRDLSVEGANDFEPYERSRPAIDAAHRRIFVGASDGGLYALRATDLTTVWRFQTDGAVQSEPLYDPREDVVYFGSNDGALYKLRAADGHMLWRFASNAEITRKPVMAGGSLLAVNANDTLIAIQPRTGELKWYRQRTPAFGMEISGYAGPAVHGDTVYTAFSDGVVMAYKIEDGAEAWSNFVDLAGEAQQSRGGEELRYLDVDTTPVVGSIDGAPLVYVASYEGGVYALDAATGAQAWVNDAAVGVTELAMWEGPARDGGTHRVLVGASGLTGLWGLRPKDGGELWRRDLPSGGVSAPASWGGALLVGTTRFGMFLVSPLDGGVLDGIHNGGSFAAAPSAYGLRAFMISNDGVLLALSLRTP